MDDIVVKWLTLRQVKIMMRRKQLVLRVNKRWVKIRIKGDDHRIEQKIEAYRRKIRLLRKLRKKNMKAAKVVKVAKNENAGVEKKG